MGFIVVEVRSVDGRTWDEVSRYNAEHSYTSTRHTPPKFLTAKQIAEEDKGIFMGRGGYGRPARVVTE